MEAGQPRVPRQQRKRIDAGAGVVDREAAVEERQAAAFQLDWKSPHQLDGPEDDRVLGLADQDLLDLGVEPERREDPAHLIGGEGQQGQQAQDDQRDRESAHGPPAG